MARQTQTVQIVLNAEEPALCASMVRGDGFGETYRCWGMTDSIEGHIMTIIATLPEDTEEETALNRAWLEQWALSFTRRFC